jgi:hypothetical protein
MVSDPDPLPASLPDDSEGPQGESAPGVQPGSEDDVVVLRETVQELRAKLEKKSKKAARWKAEAKGERVRSAKLEAALRRATMTEAGSVADLGDIPVDPPLDDGGLDPRP